VNKHFHLLRSNELEKKANQKHCCQGKLKIDSFLCSPLQKLKAKGTKKCFVPKTGVWSTVQAKGFLKQFLLESKQKFLQIGT
jgi:hypothetical protein